MLSGLIRFFLEQKLIVFLLVLFLANRDSQADRTWVFFDENDVLTHVGTTLDADKAEYRMPWSSID